MDIFSLPKQRNPGQKQFTYPLQQQLQPGQDVFQAINKDIQKRFSQQSSSFEKYINNKYIEIDYKVNKCTNNCYKDAKTYQQMKQCKVKCGTIQKRLPQFIEHNTSHMNELLNECLNKGRNMKQNEMYRCYDSYIRGFRSLKMMIEQESGYYR